MRWKTHRLTGILGDIMHSFPQPHSCDVLSVTGRSPWLAYCSSPWEQVGSNRVYLPLEETSLRTIRSGCCPSFTQCEHLYIEPEMSCMTFVIYYFIHQTRQRSTFFSVFYLCINAGSLLSTIVTPILRGKWGGKLQNFTIFSLVAVASPIWHMWYCLQQMLYCALFNVPLPQARSVASTVNRNATLLPLAYQLLSWWWR